MIDCTSELALNTFDSNSSSYNIQEVFHVYLNKFEIAVTHLFLIIVIIELHRLV